MDIDQIKTLVELMVANDLSRIEIQEGESHILLRRGQPAMVGGAMMSMPMQVAAAPAAASAAAPSSPPPAASAAAPEAVTETFIRSPMVGTFYTAASPDSPPFIQAGSTVGPESVVCLIEAMKVFNEIKAEVSGRVTRVLVQNAQAVEYDQPLFAVSPA